MENFLFLPVPPSPMGQGYAISAIESLIPRRRVIAQSVRALVRPHHAGLRIAERLTMLD